MTVHTRYEYRDGRLEHIDIRIGGETKLSIPFVQREPVPQPVVAQPAAIAVDAPPAESSAILDAQPAALPAGTLPDAEAALLPPALGEATVGLSDQPDVPVNVAAAIRGGYTSIFAFVSGAGTVVVDQAANLGLPPYWTVAITAIGAGVGYATKKRIKPNGMF